MSAVLARLSTWDHTCHEGDPIVDSLLDDISLAKAEIERLQLVIDSRPAINAALPQSYVLWSQAIYMMEASHASGRPS